MNVFFRRGFVGGCALVDFIYFDFDCPFGCKGMRGANHSTGPSSEWAMMENLRPSCLSCLLVEKQERWR